ncbi:hypothetical protein HNP40_002101 [Mycobacteroides chelonae]|nr:hypothetical protein [Mycobacteroides chelonae]
MEFNHRDLTLHAFGLAQEAREHYDALKTPPDESARQQGVIAAALSSIACSLAAAQVRNLD